MRPGAHRRDQRLLHWQVRDHAGVVGGPQAGRRPVHRRVADRGGTDGSALPKGHALDEHLVDPLVQRALRVPFQVGEPFYQGQESVVPTQPSLLS